MSDNIKQEDNKFFLTVDGYRCLLAYDMYDDKTVIFHHTYVPEELRGKGLAKLLIKEGMDWAIRNNLKVVPTCSAVQRYISMNKEYSDYMVL